MPETNVDPVSGSPTESIELAAPLESIVPGEDKPRQAKFKRTDHVNFSLPDYEDIYDARKLAIQFVNMTKRSTNAHAIGAIAASLERLIGGVKDRERSFASEYLYSCVGEHGQGADELRLAQRRLNQNDHRKDRGTVIVCDCLDTVFWSRLGVRSELTGGIYCSDACKTTAEEEHAADVLAWTPVVRTDEEIAQEFAERLPEPTDDAPADLDPVQAEPVANETSATEDLI